MADSVPKAPKVFVSYSWTNQDHVDRIVAWCERLVSDSIDVEIDRWSLNEGDDKYAFMERMVTDSSITHVLIFSDARYAQKANNRARGVGTESQIISAELSGRTAQDRFLPIVCEFDEHGEPCVPVFLKSRIYFNFSTPEAANENWEKLVRRIFNRPALTKPKLGKPPSYLEEGRAPASLTASKFFGFKDAILKGRPNVRLWIADYLDAVEQQLNEFRGNATDQTREAAAEKIHAAITSMLPLRNELIEFVGLVLGGLSPVEAEDSTADLLDRLLKARFWRPEQGSYSEWWSDPLGFFAYEVFLYVVAAHVRLHRFDLLASLLGRRFVVPEGPRGRSRARPFTTFRFYSRLLGGLNERANPRRLSIEADLINQRATLPAYPMMALMQSDLLCCLRVVTHPSEYNDWPPLTTVYAEYLGTLDLFLQAEDRRTFAQLAPVIGVENKGDLEAKLKAWYEKHPDRLSWLFRYGDLSLESLIGFDNLSTKG